MVCRRLLESFVLAKPLVDFNSDTRKRKRSTARGLTVSRKPVVLGRAASLAVKEGAARELARGSGTSHGTSGGHGAVDARGGGSEGATLRSGGEGFSGGVVSRLYFVLEDRGADVRCLTDLSAAHASLTSRDADALATHGGGRSKGADGEKTSHGDHGPGAESAGKVVFFLRTSQTETLTVANIGQVILFGDLPTRGILHSMASLFELVYMPLLRARHHHAAAVPVTGRELEREMEVFLAVLGATIGKLRGETRLPLPVGLDMREVVTLCRELTQAVWEQDIRERKADRTKPADASDSASGHDPSPADSDDDFISDTSHEQADGEDSETEEGKAVNDETRGSEDDSAMLGNSSSSSSSSIGSSSIGGGLSGSINLLGSVPARAEHGGMALIVKTDDPRAGGAGTIEAMNQDELDPSLLDDEALAKRIAALRKRMGGTVTDSVVRALETACSRWLQLIRGVLNRSPERLLAAGKYKEPMDEVVFWEERRDDLRGVAQQLSSYAVSNVSVVLEAVNSSFLVQLKKIQSLVDCDCKIAESNARYLEPLKGYLESFMDLARSDFCGMFKASFRRIFASILMIWSRSTYYNTPTRVFVLFRLLASSLIDAAADFVAYRDDRALLLRSDAEDVTFRLTSVLNVVASFVETFHEFKRLSRNVCPRAPWAFHASTVFLDLHVFMDRCNDIVYYFKCSKQYRYVEGIDIGGARNQVLTTSLQAVQKNFFDAHHAVAAVQYDVLNVGTVATSQFDADFGAFRDAVKECDMRLGSLLVQAFESCGSVLDALKVLDSFEELLEREMIVVELGTAIQKFAFLLLAHVEETEAEFVRDCDNPSVCEFLPPIARKIRWARMLRGRASGPVVRFKQLRERSLGAVLSVSETLAHASTHAANAALSVGTDGDEVQRGRQPTEQLIAAYDALIVRLDKYEDEIQGEWISDTLASLRRRLDRPLLTWQAKSVLGVSSEADLGGRGRVAASNRFNHAKLSSWFNR